MLAITNWPIPFHTDEDCAGIYWTPARDGETDEVHLSSSERQLNGRA